MSKTNITAAELLELMNSGKQPVLLDVREKIEFHTYNVGGINVPLAQLPDYIEDAGHNKNDQLIVVCKAGLRSRTAQVLLQQHGYTNVLNLTGGLIAIQKINNSL
ncbi:rhodanese-like domain-containing protein [Mucilaginibacter roseus]|uniref:Rhodanese-like domain-containing protein n=1 Tax=Mucilaginibacter roseus TaxID=1528868 RepID=A0ABS8TYJ7_9SPHI|nr:rhodanese-like domain-containing protein [Mucilaginibacter roseus]MCD8739939.1 rhodanese-like domain-containing protein [Mucilaginibacter roseus]